MVLDSMVQEGHGWTEIPNISFTWHREASVVVPAGTFSDCWTARQDVTYTAFSTYCRGIGPVRVYSQDLRGNGFDAQLSAKSF